MVIQCGHFVIPGDGEPEWTYLKWWAIVETFEMPGNGDPVWTHL
uniref:Uncharacterized protein n=1 Tax=Trichinella nativa TaxID=6335 RepID=A0A0V1KIH8_9BILA